MNTANQLVLALAASLPLGLGCAEGTVPFLALCADPASGCAASGTGPEGGTAGASVGASLGGAAGGAIGPLASAGMSGVSVAGAGGAGSQGSAGSLGNGAGGVAGGAAGGGSAGSAASGGSGGGASSVAKDLTPGKLASADSEESGNPAERGNDGNVGTRWCAGDAELGHHWTVDLGQAHQLSGLEIMFEFEGRDYGYVVEGSLDDDNYTTLLDRTGNPKQTQVQTESLSASARYVRVRFVALPSDTWASFFELKVLGT